MQGKAQSGARKAQLEVGKGTGGLTCLTASQHIHEGGLARTTAAHQGSQDSWPEAAIAVVQQLQHILAIDHSCLGAQLLRVSRHALQGISGHVGRQSMQPE